ncbi:MAG: tyrosine-type recombinase/integrase [Candidatus Omnitrophica bacterium]|nr:tyrosine-type recombinase/integrase [Candidatus Omnitrophota bacterium]
MGKNNFKNGIRAVKGSPGLWDINYQVNGVRKTARLPFDSYDEALVWRLVQKSALREKKEGHAAAVKISEALDAVIKKVQGEIEQNARCKTSLSEVIPSSQRFFKDYPAFMGKNWIYLEEITPEDLEGYKNYYSGVLKKPQGLSTEMGKIQNILTHLYQLKKINSQRLFEFRQVKRPRKNIRPFIGNPDEDFIMVLNWIKDKKPRLFEFLHFVTNTARRPKEVRQYLREYVSLNQNYIYIQSDITKNKKPSGLHLDAALKKDVISAVNFSRKMNSKFLFLNDQGKPFSANNPQVNFKEAAKACGMTNWEKWSVYQLKKRFMTTTRRQKFSGEAISQVSGHTDLDSVIKNYSFPDTAQAEEVLKAGRLKV